MSQESDPASIPAAQWQEPEGLLFDRTEVTGETRLAILSECRDPDKRAKKKGRLRDPFIRIGRHNWIRTNDPHHVKVVL